MAIESVKNLLCEAQKANTSIIAFDALDYETIYACIRGAEASRRPVILMLYPDMQSIISFSAFVDLVKALAKDASVPVAMHLDHCSSFETILSAIHAGFTSVMADGSALPFDENVAFTKSVVDVAKVFGVDVEGELGHVGQVAAGFAYHDKNTFTRPEDAALFAEKTGVTSLAVAFGSCHGMYKDPPNLDLERLQEIDKATDTPLVLHGGSGIPAQQLEQAFALGINKFNVATEYIMLYEKLLHQYYTEKFGKCSPFEKFPFVRKHLTEYVAEKLTLCKLTV